MNSSAGKNCEILLDTHYNLYLDLDMCETDELPDIGGFTDKEINSDPELSEIQHKTIATQAAREELRETEIYLNKLDKLHEGDPEWEKVNGVWMRKDRYE